MWHVEQSTITEQDRATYSVFESSIVDGCVFCLELFPDSFSGSFWTHFDDTCFDSSMTHFGLYFDDSEWRGCGRSTGGKSKYARDLPLLMFLTDCCGYLQLVRVCGGDWVGNA